MIFIKLLKNHHSYSLYRSNNPNFSETVLVKEATRAEIKDNPFLKNIVIAKRELLKEIYDKENKEYNETDLTIKISFMMPSESIELKESCREILHEMKKFDAESQKLLNS